MKNTHNDSVSASHPTLESKREVAKKLLFVINEPTCFISHRLPIAIAARDAGYEIHVATGEPTVLQRIIDEGFSYHPIPLSRSGRHIISELRSLLAIYRLMKHIKPDIVHLVTIKPVIYGSIAARLARVPAVVAAVPGLGYAFIDQYLEAKCLRVIISKLYRHAFRHNNLKVIFQNTDDQDILLNLKALQKNQAILIQGSGVDLTHYQYHPEPSESPLIVVMAARLLRDKGVVEYVQAAKLLRSKGISARFLLAGKVDPGNPSSISEKQLNTWIDNQDIEYLGYRQDTPYLLSQAHLVVLPSYREGLPRVLSEAAACGRAIVTTDVPGCRAAIMPGKTGLLAKARDVTSLADAMHTLLINPTLRNDMGAAGRKFAEREFDIENIVDEHMQIYQMISDA
ncbi:MAG: glycosyltransferase family 4 protein [Legionellaceae bacterium]|nr:glycosyltransferase family 4 protein [Legionellaceae bacterium]